jgi:hypothetical protein
MFVSLRSSVHQGAQPYYPKELSGNNSYNYEFQRRGLESRHEVLIHAVRSLGQ